MNNWDYAKDIPANPARGSMTIPRELSLATIGGELTLLQNPVKEILGSAINDETFTITTFNVKSGVRYTSEDGRTIEFGYDPIAKEIYIDRSGAWYDIDSSSIQEAPFDSHGHSFDIRVVTDSGSIELFVAGGRVAITDLVAPSALPWVATPF
jgi:sucrose-6-phosphate hydrolase SacC (GH32 family)